MWTKLANDSVDKSHSKVTQSKNDKDYRHDKISKVEAHVYLFRSLALKVALRNEDYKRPILINVYCESIFIVD